MSDSTTRDRLRGVSLSMLLLVAAFGGVIVTPAAAAGNADHDAETTVTTSTSGILAGTTVGNAAAKNNYTNAQIITDQNASKYVIRHKKSGYVAYTNTSLEHIANDGANVHLRANISHPQLLDVQHKPGQNVTIESVAYNATTGATVNDTVEAYLQFSNDTATETVTDAEAADSDLVSITNTSGWLTIDKDNSVLTMEDKSVPNETYYVALGNGTVSDDLQAVTDAADSKPGVSNVWAPGPNAFVLVTTGDSGTMPIPVYTKSNAPSDASGWYATIQDVGGTNGLAVHVPEDTDASEMDVTVKTGTGINAWAYLTMFDAWNLGDIIPSTIDFSGLTSGGVGMTVFGAGVAATAARRRGGA